MSFDFCKIKFSHLKLPVYHYDLYKGELAFICVQNECRTLLPTLLNFLFKVDKFGHILQCYECLVKSYEIQILFTKKFNLLVSEPSIGSRLIMKGCQKFLKHRAKLATETPKSSL